MKKNLFAFLLVIFTVYSCGPGFQLSTNQVPGTNFKQYKTYAWLSPDSSLTSGQDLSVTLGNMIMDISNKELKKKGMILDTQNPDALFSYKVGTEIVTSYSQTPSVSVGIGVGGPGYYVGGSVPVAGGDIVAKQSQAATLNLQMFDTKSTQVIWLGTAKKTMDQMGGNTQKNLQTALHNLFYRLPVRHKVQK